MNKLLIVILTVCMLFNMFCVNTSAFAVEQTDNAVVYTYSDGSQLIVVIEEIENEFSSRAASSTITKTKTARYKDADGVVQWEYVLTASFSFVSGVSATCTSASYTYTINDDRWHFSDGAATKSGNKANGVGTFKRKVLLITTKTVNIDLTLTCDVNGNVT